MTPAVDAPVVEAPVVVEASFAEVRDVLVEGGIAWVATSGGVLGWDEDLLPVRPRDPPSRDVRGLAMEGGRVVAVTERGAFRLEERWTPTEVETRWRGRAVATTRDGRLLVDGVAVSLPGPAVDVAVVGGELRVATVMAAVVWGDERRVLSIPATAAGPVWGTADGALVRDDGTRVGAVPGAVTALGAHGDGWVVGTRAGAWWVGRDTRRLDDGGPCGNFVTGLARWGARLVVGTFDGGACVRSEGGWTPIAVPSPMVNDVLAVGDTLWIATAEGLVRVEGDRTTVVGEVADDAPRAAPGLNHPGVNALATDGRGAVWAADVLGPVRVAPTWARYRWHVSGHSYQAVAACPTGEVWAGSEDDGLAVRGVGFGRPNGASPWRHVSVYEGLPEDWTMAVACAGKGAAWVGTYRSGVGRVDAAGWRPVAGLEGAWVQALAVDGADLWVGTADGVFVVEGAGGAGPGVAAPRARKVADEDVWTLLVEADAVWAGTRTGLVRLPRAAIAERLREPEVASTMEE